MDYSIEKNEYQLPTGAFDKLYKCPFVMSGEVVRVAKKNLKAHIDHPYLKRHGIYILRSGKTLYTGKTDTQTLYNRICQHKNDAQAWWWGKDAYAAEVICISDSYDALDSSCLGYLESELVKMSKNINNECVDNVYVPKYNILPSAVPWAESFLKSVLFILSKLDGYNKFFRYTSQDDHKSVIEKMTDYIYRWSHDLLRSNQYKRRNGWTFRPSMGNLDQQKLEELQIWLLGMFGNRNEFVCNLYNVDEIRKEYGLYPTKDDPLTSSEDLFTRQQKNYMDKLELIKRIKGTNKYILTERGKKYLNSSDKCLYSFLISSLEHYQWFEIEIRNFARQVLFELGDSHINEEEFVLFLSHGGVVDYKYYRPAEIANFISAYRDLGKNDRLYISKYAEKCINETDKSRSQTSYQRITGAQCKEAMSDVLGNDLFDLSLCEKFKNKYPTENPKYLINKIF
jgi:hypothetical protein